MNEKFLNRLVDLAVIIFIFGVMFLLNYLMPLHRDDYDYSMIWKTGEHINSLADVFDSTWEIFQRVLSEFIFVAGKNSLRPCKRRDVCCAGSFNLFSCAAKIKN